MVWQWYAKTASPLKKKKNERKLLHRAYGIQIVLQQQRGGFVINFIMIQYHPDPILMLGNHF